MPRVVPRMVVELIDTAFKDALEKGTLRAPWAPKAPTEGPALAGILALVDALPGEFLTVLSPEDYAAFIVNVAAIRNQLALWQAGDRDLRQSPLYPVKGYEPENPVGVVRHVLEQCPDELPAAGSHELDFIADETFRAILLRDIGSTEEALGNNEYKAATVLAASVVEALLLWALSAPARTAQVDASAAGTKLLANARGRWGCTASSPSAALEYGDLNSYLDIVQDIGGVITPDTFALANTARNFRNLIHPGRAQRTAAQCDRGTALATVGALVCVIRDLTPG